MLSLILSNIVIFLLKKLTCREEFEKFKEPLINSFLEKILNEDLIGIIEDKYKIELDKWLPILMKSNSKYNNIDINIMKNTFEHLDIWLNCTALLFIIEIDNM